MSGKYRYDHRTVKKHHFVAAAIVVCLAIVGGGVALIAKDLSQDGNSSAQGTTRVVGQVVGENQAGRTFEEPLFSIGLPGDWKETARSNHPTETSVTFSSIKKGQSERSLKIFVDTIPTTKEVNRMMPVTITGGSLASGDVSENCATFTQGGTLEVAKAIKLKPALARWQGVDFMCDLANVVDNKVGVSSKDGVNTVTITGPAKGMHKYFFLYIDRTIQPDYTILSDALASFRAK